MINKRIVAVGLASFLLLATACTSKSTENKEKFFTVDLCAPIVRTYLDAETEADQIVAFKNMENTTYDRPALELTWEGGTFLETYTVSIADNSKFKDAYVEETKRTSLEIGHCIPGQKYWYKVEQDGKTIDLGSFLCVDKPVRYVDVDGVSNMRDLGGWKTQSGEKVAYGLLYRAGSLQEIRPKGIKTVTQTLDIKTEIDLRDPQGHDGGQTMCAFGDEYNFFTFPLYAYMYNVPSSFVYNRKVEQSFVDMFEVLSERDNYPIVFHCTAGADRTGFLSFIINGLLGVSFADLTRDFELTTTSIYGGRVRAKITETGFDYTVTTQDIKDAASYCWTYMYQTILEDYGEGTEDLSLAIENYLLSFGVSQKQIEDVRDILLDR